MLEELKIDSEFEKVIPPLTNDEYHQLKENILDDEKDLLDALAESNVNTDNSKLEQES